jgi:hypothetical protein
MAELTHATRVPSFVSRGKPLAAAMGIVGLGAGFAAPADAASIVVNNLSGSSVVGQCTLPDAVYSAVHDTAVNGCAAGSGADVITFTVSGTISLPNQLDIYSNVTISGPGAANLTIAPSGTNRAFNIYGGPTVTISGVTIQGNGTANVRGGAILLYSGNLTIQNCVLSGNVTTSRGGAIYIYSGGLTVQSSTFTGNKASSGGAIYNYFAGDMSIDGSTFSGNQATGQGGAIMNDGGGFLTITNSTLSGNQANAGGAIYLYDAANATITNSTISGNSAIASTGGGIKLSYTNTTINNSTVTGNSAVGAGGNIWLYSSTLTLNSTIVANGTDNGNGPDIFDVTGGTVNADHSLVESQTGWINNIGTANIIGQDPSLGPLANNGGPTLTHALLAGSPAIDKGSNPSALTTDQRGVGFVRTAAAAIDIGAFEVQGAAPPPPTPTQVPALAPLGLAALSALLGGVGAFGARRRRRLPEQ